MQEFAALLDRLILTPSRNAKLKLLADYFRATPDPGKHSFATRAIQLAVLAHKAESRLMTWQIGYFGSALPRSATAPFPPPSGTSTTGGVGPGSWQRRRQSRR